MCFAIGSQRLWCCKPQPKHVRLWFGAWGPDQNTYVCGLVLWAPTKTRAAVVWCLGPRPKHVCLWFGVVGPNQNTCACGLVLGAPTKTRLQHTEGNPNIQSRGVVFQLVENKNLSREVFGTQFSKEIKNKTPGLN